VLAERSVLLRRIARLQREPRRHARSRGRAHVA
jgi:hypothetical protein